MSTAATPVAGSAPTVNLRGDTDRSVGRRPRESNRRRRDDAATTPRRRHCRDTAATATLPRRRHCRDAAATPPRRRRRDAAAATSPRRRRRTTETPRRTISTRARARWRPCTRSGVRRPTSQDLDRGDAAATTWIVRDERVWAQVLRERVRRPQPLRRWRRPVDHGRYGKRALGRRSRGFERDDDLARLRYRHDQGRQRPGARALGHKRRGRTGGRPDRVLGRESRRQIRTPCRVEINRYALPTGNRYALPTGNQPLRATHGKPTATRYPRESQLAYRPIF